MEQHFYSSPRVVGAPNPNPFKDSASPRCLADSSELTLPLGRCSSRQYTGLSGWELVVTCWLRPWAGVLCGTQPVWQSTFSAWLLPLLPPCSLIFPTSFLTWGLCSAAYCLSHQKTLLCESVHLAVTRLYNLKQETSHSGLLSYCQRQLASRLTLRGPVTMATGLLSLEVHHIYRMSWKRMSLIEPTTVFLSPSLSFSLL